MRQAALMFIFLCNLCIPSSTMVEKSAKNVGGKVLPPKDGAVVFPCRIE